MDVIVTNEVSIANTPKIASEYESEDICLSALVCCNIYH